MLTIENTSRRRVRDYERERHASSRKGRRKINFSLVNIGKGIDIPFVLLIFVLLAIGITMMFSASYPVAYYEIGDSYYYLKRQLIFAIVGLIIMIAVSFVDYHYYHRFAAIILGVSYFALMLVLVLPSQEGGVHRWIGVGMFGIQASEISKFAIILFMAHWGSRYYDRMDTFKYGVLPGAAVFLSTALLLLFEPHYSCIVIIGILTVVMMYVSGIKIKWLAIGAAILAVLILLLWVTGMLTYAMERMDGWGQALNEDLDRDMWNSTWQTRNSLYAIGSGGLFGLGLGQSRQKYLYLPEPQNDFIFAIVCEELGLVGAVIILLFEGRESKIPIIRLCKGAYGLYGTTGYLSDILSYSRLLALGLATGVIASVFNKIGSMMGDGVVGVIVFILIFIIGHGVNIGINALGAYVHTNRLQFVEFFGKFYTGGGNEFKPFKINTKHYTVKEEN